MEPLFLFVLILVLVFALIMLLTRPTRKEKLVQTRLHAAASRSGINLLEHVDILKRDSYSDVPLLNSLFMRLKPAFRLRKLIEDAEQNWSVGRLVSGSLCAGILVYWILRLWLENPIVPPLLGTCTFLSPYGFLLWKRRQRLNKFTALLPDAMDLISRALRAGHSLSASMELVAQEIPKPIGTEFRRIFEEQNLGLPLRDALLNLTERVPLPDVHFMVAAMLIQRETGGNLVEVLDKTTVLLRDRMRLRGQIRVYTAQGRLTGWILCLLPIVAFFALSMVDADYTNILLTDPLGKKLLVLGACLMVLGILVIRKIINIKV